VVCHHVPNNHDRDRDETNEGLAMQKLPKLLRVVRDWVRRDIDAAPVPPQTSAPARRSNRDDDRALAHFHSPKP
jgi:hypothetical protein